MFVYLYSTVQHHLRSNNRLPHKEERYARSVHGGFKSAVNDIIANGAQAQHSDVAIITSENASDVAIIPSENASVAEVARK